MALVVTNLGQLSDPTQINQFINLFTGVMTDQPITFGNSLTVNATMSTTAGGNVGGYSFIGRRSGGAFGFPDLYGTSGGVVVGDIAAPNTQTHWTNTLIENRVGATVIESISATGVSLTGTVNFLSGGSKWTSATSGIMDVSVVDALNGPALQALAPPGKASSILIVPASDVPQGGAMTSQLMLFGSTGTNYDRFAISNVSNVVVIDSTYNGIGAARAVYLQMGGSVSNAITSRVAWAAGNDASLDLVGSSGFSAQGKNWYATGLRVADPENRGTSYLIFDTRTGTPTSNAADATGLRFRRGGSEKWLLVQNWQGSNIDNFDIAPAAGNTTGSFVYSSNSTVNNQVFKILNTAPSGHAWDLGEMFAVGSFSLRDRTQAGQPEVLRLTGATKTVAVDPSGGFDTITAGTLNIGTTNANALTIGRVGVLATVAGPVTVGSGSFTVTAGDEFLADGRKVFFGGANGSQSYSIGILAAEPTRTLSINARMAGADMRFVTYDGSFNFRSEASEVTVASISTVGNTKLGDGTANSRNTLVLSSDAPRLYLGVVGAGNAPFKISAQDTIGNSLQFYSGTVNADPTLSTYTELMRLTSTGTLLLQAGFGLDTTAAGDIWLGQTTATNVKIGKSTGNILFQSSISIPAGYGFDTQTANGQLNVGTINANDIRVGRSAATTQILGPFGVGSVVSYAAVYAPLSMNTSVAGLVSGVVVADGTITYSNNNNTYRAFETRSVTLATGTTTGTDFFAGRFDAASFSKTGTGSIANAYGLYVTAPSIATANTGIYAYSGGSGQPFVVDCSSAGPWSMIMRRSDLGGSKDIQFFNNAGEFDIYFAGTPGMRLNATGGPGFYGHAAPAQPAAPVTLADVIAIIRGCGLSA